MSNCIFDFFKALFNRNKEEINYPFEVRIKMQPHYRKIHELEKEIKLHQGIIDEIKHHYSVNEYFKNK